MGMHGNAWECMGMHGNSLECMGMHENAWQLIDLKAIDRLLWAGGGGRRWKVDD